MRTVKEKPKLVKPNFIARIFNTYKSIWKEIGWLYYYVRTVKNASETYEFKSKYLRVDWVFRIYTVVNLTLDEATWPALEQKNKILEKLSDIHDYFRELDIHDIIELKDTPIIDKNSKVLLSDTDELVDAPVTSYLIVYNFMYEYLTAWMVIKHAALLVTLIYFWHPITIFVLPYVTYIYNFFLK
jgi:hypothetical protein